VRCIGRPVGKRETGLKTEDGAVDESETVREAEWAMLALKIRRSKHLFLKSICI